MKANDLACVAESGIGTAGHYAGVSEEGAESVRG